jgi:hypothetical protein
MFQWNVARLSESSRFESSCFDPSGSHQDAAFTHYKSGAWRHSAETLVGSALRAVLNLPIDLPLAATATVKPAVPRGWTAQPRSSATLSGGSNLARAFPLDAWPYRAKSIPHRRPGV